VLLGMGRAASGAELADIDSDHSFEAALVQAWWSAGLAVDGST
jgi:hypothetical protein